MRDARGLESPKSAPHAILKAGTRAALDGSKSALAETKTHVETLENALRRFKNNVGQENIVREIQRHSLPLSPGEKDCAKPALSGKLNRKPARPGLG